MNSNMNKEGEKIDAVETTTKLEQTTMFVNNAETIVEESKNVISIPRPYFENCAETEYTTVHKFLRKPVELLTGEFSATDVSNSFGPALPMPFSALDNNIYWPKLKGFFGFRATTVFTLQVNGQRFQQGRYMLVYVPTGGTLNSGSADTSFEAHAATLVSRTQCPHVEIDINRQTSVELRIPFNSAYDFFMLQHNTAAASSKWGMFQLFPYVPLLSGSGSLTAKFTLWCHFEDVELVGQAIPLERQSNSMKEAKSKDAGPIESTALKIKEAASIVGSVPLLTSYVQPLSWVADLVARTANVFGWAAPANIDKQYRVETSFFSYATNVDKVDKVNPLSYSLKNAVQVLPGEAMDAADELDIVHMSSRFAYQATFVWADTDAEEALLAQYFVGMYPTGAPLAHVQGPIVLQDYTPAQWIGKRFEMYRGSVKFRFKIVKTDFHSGRLSIDFNPETRFYISPPMTDDVSPYLHRQIIDVRDLSEFTIEFPFISPIPYLGTHGNGETHFGRIDIRVIDPLVSPATVSNSINIILESAMCGDVEFAGRRNARTIIYNDYEIQSNSMTIGSSSSRTAQNETSATTIGEKIINLRSILKRYEPLTYFGDGLGTYTSDNTNTFRPFNWGKFHTIIPFSVIKGDLLLSDNVENDLYSELGTIFTYARGGVRLKMIPKRGKANDLDTTVYQDALEQNVIAVLGQANFTATNIRSVTAPAVGPFIATTAIPNIDDGAVSNTNTNNFTVAQTDRDLCLEIQVPQWNRQHSRAGATHISDAYIANNADEVSKAFVNVYQIPYTVHASTNYPHFSLDVWRAGADDANFSGFISIPPMRVFSRGTA